ncbi:hypothetical protein [Pseudooceanicola algae]|uniref:Uncharacterized protein n=1 Tax=Pseudooceanicola algae TaxID=1537215 RepID=A0A418SD73_9RHOB|nr:hypothetical protein [Pseudooceanicola algae]QPM92558.1 hypothetical protein PSAL_038220 [Pseudooceanicola algae]
MAITNFYHQPVYIMTEEETLEGTPCLIWLSPGARYPGGHDGVALPGQGRVWKCLGKQVGGLFLGFPTRVHADGRVTGLWTFALRDPDFFQRHPEWQPLQDVAMAGYEPP